MPYLLEGMSPCKGPDRRLSSSPGLRQAAGRPALSSRQCDAGSRSCHTDAARRNMTATDTTLYPCQPWRKKVRFRLWLHFSWNYPARRAQLTSSYWCFTFYHFRLGNKYADPEGLHYLFSPTTPRFLFYGSNKMLLFLFLRSILCFILLLIV